MKRWQSIVLPAALGLAVGAAGFFAVEPRLPKSPLVEGLTIDGEAVGEDARAGLEARQAELQAQPIQLHGDGKIYDATLGELGAYIDIGATIAAAEAVGHQGSIVKRVREAARARRGEIDIPIVYGLDQHAAALYLERFADDLKIAPVDARIDLDAHAKIPDKPGREIDARATASTLAETFLSARSVALATQPVVAKVTLAELDSIDVTKLLASFETQFETYKHGRAVNVALAASFIDGIVLKTGESFSFNEKVGPRTVDRGFQEAPEIMGDELTVGIGGGTCQVSSTLYAAALYGGMTIVDRRSHTRPSSYTQLGLDATVSYGKVDLKIGNPYSFPVVVHTLIPKPGLLRIEILGGEAVEKVEYRYGVSNIENYVRRITVKEWMQPGKSFRKQKGTRGMDVHSAVTIRYLNGKVEQRSYFSGYNATPEVFWVAPDVNQEDLPELPEHAKGVEGQLHLDGSDVYADSG